MINLNELCCFLVKAKQSTYASGDESIKIKEEDGYQKSSDRRSKLDDCNDSCSHGLQRSSRKKNKRENAFGNC